MIKKWLKSLIREAVFDQFHALHRKIDKEFNELSKDINNLDFVVPPNVKKLEEMINEVKGCISMARASLQDRRDVFNEINSAFDKQFDKFKDKYFVITKMSNDIHGIKTLLEKKCSKDRK